WKAPITAVVIALLVNGFGNVLLAAQQTSETDTPELAQRFPKEAQRADYIIALDRSLSMAGYWSATRTALEAFIRAVPDGDHVSFITFSKSASNSQLIPRTLTASARASLLEELAR